MSFLSNRPPDLLSSLRQIKFKYWLTGKWKPEALPPSHGYAYSHWVFSITTYWSEMLEALQAILGKNLSHLSIDLTLIQPPVFTYRIRHGVTKSTLGLLRNSICVVLEEALEQFRVDGGWPQQEVIVDGTQNYMLPLDRTKHMEA